MELETESGDACARGWRMGKQTETLQLKAGLSALWRDAREGSLRLAGLY